MNYLCCKWYKKETLFWQLNICLLLYLSRSLNMDWQQKKIKIKNTIIYWPYYSECTGFVDVCVSKILIKLHLYKIFNTESCSLSLFIFCIWNRIHCLSRFYIWWRSSSLLQKWCNVCIVMYSDVYKMCLVWKL